MNHFTYQFSKFSEKLKKIYQLEVWIFCEMHHRIPFFLALCLSVRQFQMPLLRVKFCESIGNIWNYLPNRPTSTKYD